MSFINSETWAWFKTAPLPVVLSICLSSFGILATWSYANEKKIAEQKAKVEVAVAAASAAKDASERAEDKMDKANEKLDKLLEGVLKLQAEAAAKKEKK